MPKPASFGKYNDLNLTLTDLQKADGWHYPLTKEQEWDKYGYVVRDQIRFSLHVQDGLVDVVEDYLETNKKAREWAVLQQCSGSSDNFVVAWTIVRRGHRDQLLLPPPLEQAVKKRRAAVTDSVTGLEGVRVLEYQPSSSWGLNPSTSLERDRLWTLWVQSGASNLRFQEMQRSGAPIAQNSDCHRAWVLNKFEKFTDDQLKVPAFRPDAISFFHFIEHVAGGGPTAARSVWHQLQFLRDRLGLDLPLADLKEFVMGKARGQPVTQARVVEPAFAVGPLYALSRSAGPGKVLLQVIFMALVSCIRWRHLQRSYFTHEDGTLLHAHCIQGKRRVQGVRPPYSWTAPLLSGLCSGLPGIDASPDWARGLQD
ncbi:unnamed protein product [Symbiodinium sp. CCMP2592]|nr:unnamed protein product [Symbiodinium sp. CCMP2592]